VIRMNIFIAQSPSVVMKRSRDFGATDLFSNDLYISQNEPFKLHRLCAISHTNILSPSAWPRWSKGQRFCSQMSVRCGARPVLTARVRPWTNCRRRWEIRLGGFS